MMSAKQRLDQSLVKRGLAETRSQAENLIKLGLVEVDGELISKPGFFVSEANKIKLISSERYVSRAGLKLADANKTFKISFGGKVVLDVGSSTGGFTDYALQNGAKKVIAVDVGTDQMHPKLAKNELVELHEQTDIRNYLPKFHPDLILVDVSFISLRQILPYLAKISGPDSQILAMLKPQFEAGKDQINRGIIKNDKLRRKILKDFESWTTQLFKIVGKSDNEVAGSKGNHERFYLLEPFIKK